eukprot:5027245-Pleurochrysis_carterae.AAC.1
MPASLASASTSAWCRGWLSLSASPFASLGTANANHCVVSDRAPASMARICATPLDAAFTAAAAGWQLPSDTTALG